MAMKQPFWAYLAVAIIVLLVLWIFMNGSFQSVLQYGGAPSSAWVFGGPSANINYNSSNDLQLFYQALVNQGTVFGVGTSVTGLNVNYVHVIGDRGQQELLVNTGDGKTWALLELDANGNLRQNPPPMYLVTNRDAWSVYLTAVGDVTTTIQIDLYRRLVVVDTSTIRGQTTPILHAASSLQLLPPTPSTPVAGPPNSLAAMVTSRCPNVCQKLSEALA